MFKCFGCLFQMTLSDYCSRWLFRTTILYAYSRLHFQMTFLDYCSRWLLRMPLSDDFSRWLFRFIMFGLLFISDGYFAWICSSEEVKWKRGLDHLLFNRRLRSSTAPWNFKQPLRNSTTNSYFSDQFVFSDFSDRFRFARPIYISTNQFVFQQRFPTAELWRRSPLTSNSD